MRFAFWAVHLGGSASGVRWAAGLAGVAFAASGAVALLAACSSDDTTAAPRDGGADTTVPTDARVGPDDSGSDAAETLSCASYCAKVRERCTGSDQQYATDDECMRICGKLPLGAQGDTSGNTVACRQYHAGNLPASTHCPHAGPYGYGTCGTRCESFCKLYVGTCTPDDAGAIFPNESACLAACGSWDPDASSTPTAPTVGNTLACREYHLRAANGPGDAAPPFHCPHAATPRDASAATGLPCVSLAADAGSD